VPKTHRAAIGRAVEKRLRPVPRQVHAEQQPEAAHPAQRKGLEQSERTRHHAAEDGFIGIAVVNSTENHGQNERRRPESDAITERGLQVPSKCEIFEDGDAPDKPFASKMQIDGPTRIEDWTESHHGKAIRQRIVYKFASDKKVTVSFQQSEDGKVWKTTANGTGEKTGS